MRITKRQLRWIIKEALDDSETSDEEVDLEAKNKIVKGLTMIGIDPAKLDNLPSNVQHLKAFISMINQAVDVTNAGKAVAAEKKVAVGTKGMA